MARYGQEHKQATRQRIIEVAGRRLKRDGIDGSGIATLMADAGLTNGAFYAHFESKEDLVANAVVEQLREQRQSFSAQPPDRAGLGQIVRAYLSVQHRDNPQGGCASAALLDEIGRCAGAVSSGRSWRWPWHLWRRSPSAPLPSGAGSRWRSSRCPAGRRGC